MIFPLSSIILHYLPIIITLYLQFFCGGKIHPFPRPKKVGDAAPPRRPAPPSAPPPPRRSGAADAAAPPSMNGAGHVCNVRPPSDVCWLTKAPVTIVYYSYLRTINHSYWSYKPT